jgi:hypothetical protein
LKSKRRIRVAASSRISVLFLISGIFSLAFSIYSESQILALIGLGLTFWGALFILLKPLRLVEGSLLYNSAVPTYLTTDRILDDFNYKGKGYYLPPYPKDVYLPEYLKGLKTSVVYISAKTNSEMPSIEEIAKGKFVSNTQKGVLVAPPGLGILTQIEDKMNVDFTKMDLNYLCEVLPIFILQDLNLAKEVAMEPNGDKVHLKLLNSLYTNLYSSRENLKSVNILGCPIASAVACALAKNSGRTVTIQKHTVSPDGSALEVWYHIVQG